MKTEDKPIVRFSGEPSFFDYPGGEELPVARVHALDHPVWGDDIIRTSVIVAMNEDGSFETLNTRYVPEDLKVAQ
jgi:hypothetical protein